MVANPFDTGDEYVWVSVSPGRKILVKKNRKKRNVATRVVSIHGTRRLSERQRFGLKIQTGRNMETYSDLDKYLRENNSRVIEPGDNVLKRTSGSDDALRKNYNEVSKGKVPFAERRIQVGYGS